MTSSTRRARGGRTVERGLDGSPIASLHRFTLLSLGLLQAYEFVNHGHHEARELSSVTNPTNGFQAGDSRT